MGDLFINQIFHMLPATNTQNRLEKKPLLYIYDNFKVKSFATNPVKPTTVEQSIARLINALINGLNENTYLPSLILVIPDWDIIQGIRSVSYGIANIFEKIIKWEIRALDQAIRT